MPMDRQCLVFEIDRVPENGMVLDRVIDGGLFDIEDEDITLNQDVELKGELKRVRRDILFYARVGTEATVRCSRCLGTFSQNVKCDAKAQFKPKEEAIQSEAEIELRAEDCEIEYYEGETISLAEVVRDAILLSFTTMVLCKDDCQGLCSQCGANLNLAPCTCSLDEVVDPRFEKLRLLKEKLK